MQKLIVVTCIVGALGLLYAQEVTVKRGRNEGTASIDASNVIGNGNITAYINLGAGITSNAIHGDAAIGAKLGIASIMQIEAAASAIDYSRLGPAEAHISLTMPGNDKLRFFGACVSGDLYLSTSQDLISINADSTRPLYSPFIRPSLTLDLDWMAARGDLPIKTYAYVGMVDDPQLLYRYNIQLASALGIEWKSSKNSIFTDIGVSLFKEKGHKLNNNIPDEAFEQFYIWLKPGGRYRILNRFSIVGNLGITVYSKLKSHSAVMPRLFSVSVRFEAPVIYRETNTEAIRTLVFMEKEKKDKNDKLAKNVKSGTKLLDEINVMIDELGEEGEDFDYRQEQEELVRRRKEIQDKMKELEQLLRESE